MNFYIILGVILVISIIFNIVIFLNNNQLLKINEELIATCQEFNSECTKYKKLADEMAVVLLKEASRNINDLKVFEEDSPDNKKVLH